LSNELDSDYITKQLTYECGMDSVAKLNFKLNNTKEAVISTVNSLMLRSYYSSTLIDFSDKKNLQNRNINTLFTFILQDYFQEKLYGTTEETFILFVNLLNNIGVLDIIERSINSLTSEEQKIFMKKIDRKTEGILLDNKKERSYTWEQLGIKWTIKWDNEIIPVPISEEFISYIQIVIFILREMDISFIKDTIQINLSISEDIGYGGIQEGYIHTVNLSENMSYSSYNQHIGKILAILYLIISNCAIVSGEQFQKEIKLIFKDNYLGNSYQYLWNNIFGSVSND